MPKLHALAISGLLLALTGLANPATADDYPSRSIRLIIPFPPGGSGEVPYLDLSWIREDTGFEPAFTTESAIADYISWLQAGNAQ